ncbi:hypothetical protein VHEMI03446 [[Torrubiella] hemipterigena]|uniref:Uncharacterized protein n=1 Tax=[Torrubiella] hemipterigena TaxID=1531966 RepID=A0A0A1TB82_9HYPO|nr:hypothetical protein VHEMI03446 [[Torrubiella] hemipterigena]
MPPRRVTGVVDDGYDDVWIRYFEEFPTLPITANFLRVMGRRKDLTIDRTPFYDKPMIPMDLARYVRHGGPDMSHCLGLSYDSVPPQPLYDDEEAKLVWSHQFYAQDVFKYMKLNAIVFDEGQDFHHVNQARLSQELAGRITNLKGALPAELPAQLHKACEEALEDEAQDYSGVIQALVGDENILSGRNVLFDGLSPITECCPLTPRPALYDGSEPSTLQALLKQPGADKVLMPSLDGKQPAAPNFFLEIAPPQPVSKIFSHIKAQYVGTYGVRAMEFLKNYGKEKPVYGGNAYVFSAVFGVEDYHLDIFLHYQLAADPDGGTITDTIHTFRMDSVSLWNNASCRQAVATLRSVRAMAAEAREMLVDHALSKVK